MGAFVLGLLNGCFAPGQARVRISQRLIVAIASDNAQAAAELLGNVPVDHEVAPGGGSALHVAAGIDSVNVAEFLLRSGADVNLRDVDGGTPLAHAAVNGSLKVARLLLEKGAAVDACDKEHRTPLHWAAIGHRNCHKLAGEFPEVRNLHEARAARIRQVFELLLAHGANPKVRETMYGLTVIDMLEQNPELKGLLKSPEKTIRRVR
jgi:hypothetical protein